jgi:uroporphyrinogen-III synthase
MEAKVKEKVKTILISQPKPEGDNKSPYTALSKKHKLKIDFRPFIHVEPTHAQEFRQNRISILEHTAIIFTSRVAVDHFFRMCEETRATVPDTMKYFCLSETTAFYLQKYVVYRKRKIFHGRVTFLELVEIMKKHKQEKFLVPCSNLLKPSIPELLIENKFHHSIAPMYRTVCSDLSDLAEVKYDMLVFFSPSGIESLMKNFPDFEQGDTVLATFGPTTAKAAEAAGLRIDVLAPHPKAPSMSMAIQQFITGK